MTIIKITTRPRRLRAAILETTDGMHRAGIMSEDTLRKTTVRELGSAAPPTAEPISRQ